MKPHNLYHFTKAETAIRKILPNMNLRMNNLGNMNDPKENLQHITDLDENVNDLFSFDGIRSDEYIIAKSISEETKIVSFSINRTIDTDGVKHEVKGSQLQRMWAQYGENSSGICIEIDYEGFINENLKQILEFNILDKKVKYNNFQFQGILTPLYGKLHVKNQINESPCLYDFWKDLQNKPKFIDERFFTKNRDWEGESEYRFLTFNKNSEEILLSISNSIKRVILGIHFSKYYLPSIYGLVSKEKVYGLRLDSTGNFEIRKI